MWIVNSTTTFNEWWLALELSEREAVTRSIRLLEEIGPKLGRPHADTVGGSKHAHMKELRTQHRGRPIRTFFAFDPSRSAILLIGGDKSGDKRFYERMIPLADRLYDRYIEQLRKDGLI